MTALMTVLFLLWLVITTVALVGLPVLVLTPRLRWRWYCRLTQSGGRHLWARDILRCSCCGVSAEWLEDHNLKVDL